MTATRRLVTAGLASSSTAAIAGCNGRQVAAIIGALALCLSTLASAASTTVSIPLRATFITTSDDENATFGTAFPLASLGLRPGDRVRIETLGAVDYCQQDCRFINPPAIAAFTAGGAPSAATTLPTGIPDADPPRTLRGNLETRMPGAFFAGGMVATELTVPAGATTLWMALPDSYYSDNAGSLSAILTRDPAPPVFQLSVNSNITAQSASAQVTFFPRAGDAGRNVGVFLFALAPAPLVKGAPATPKEVPVPCVLAQMNASGQLQSVGSASDLQALVSSVLSAQGQTVTLLDNVPTPNVAGATFFVGYGTSAANMIEQGVNRSALTVPGSVTCKPEAPQTGWWWNPAEDGRGFSIEVRGNNLFFAAFLYDISGRSTWYVASGAVSLDGTLFTNRLYSALGGQTLGGAYPGRPSLKDEGAITLAFNSASQGTLVWPGGSVPIRRFNIVPNGLALDPTPNTPESGWWWNEAESGRGFFLEWQGGSLDIAGYMYDEQGNSVWYLTVGPMTTTGSTQFTGSWWSYGNGQTLLGAWRPNTRLSTTVAPLTLTFDGPATALMTLPNGRSTRLTRHRF